MNLSHFVHLLITKNSHIPVGSQMSKPGAYNIGMIKGLITVQLTLCGDYLTYLSVLL